MGASYLNYPKVLFTAVQSLLPEETILCTLNKFKVWLRRGTNIKGLRFGESEPGNISKKKLGSDLCIFMNLPFIIFFKGLTLLNLRYLTFRHFVDSMVVPKLPCQYDSKLQLINKSLILKLYVVSISIKLWVNS